MKYQIIIDTCGVINLLSVVEKPYNKNNFLSRLYQYVREGKIELVVTPTILQELTYPLSFNPRRDTKMRRFIINHLKLREFSDEEILEIDNLSTAFSSIPVAKIENKNIFVFQNAKYSTDRNYMDKNIYCQAVYAECPIITYNLKDFKNTKYAYKVLEMLKINKKSKVYGVQEFVELYERQNAQLISEISKKLNNTKSIQIADMIQ